MTRWSSVAKTYSGNSKGFCGILSILFICLPQISTVSTSLLWTIPVEETVCTLIGNEEQSLPLWSEQHYCAASVCDSRSLFQLAQTASLLLCEAPTWLPPALLSSCPSSVEWSLCCLPLAEWQTRTTPLRPVSKMNESHLAQRCNYSNASMMLSNIEDIDNPAVSA